MNPLTIPGALATARRHCNPGCFGYHASWRLFRRTGLKATPSWHSGFYQLALDHHRLPAGQPVRALICGASDEAMLAAVTTALHPRPATVHLIDACHTPLVLANHYARRHHIDLTVQQARAPDLPDWDEPFDLIITDGLLSLLPTPGDRTTLLARLAAALTPHGLMLYTTRLAGPAGVLEYDRLGRHIQATIIRHAWPGTRDQRRHQANTARTRQSRPSPYATIPLCQDIERQGLKQNR